MKKYRGIFIILIAIAIIGISNANTEVVIPSTPKEVVEISSLPQYDGFAYCEVNNNVPFFTEEEMTTKSYERFSDLDELDRCGVVEACVGTDLMPTEERGNIGMIKPSGWQIAKYDNVDGKYLYNRCHLIGFQLTGENANEKNLITGTRYMNVDGMLPFENDVAEYVKETDNHVMYRVTPIFEGDNLVASGVLMEAKSVEDDGEGVMFNVYCYNVQPDIEINYATGESKAITKTENREAPSEDAQEIQGEVESTYILNTNSKKIHLPTCDGIKNMSEKNKKTFTGYIVELLNQGYEKCQTCNP